MPQEGNTMGSPTPPAPDAPPAPTPPPAATAPPADPPKPAEPAKDTGKTFDEAYVRQLRDEAAGHRVKAKEAEDRHNAVLAALGLKSDGKVDPAQQAEQLAAERDKAAKKARDAQVELAVFRSAGKHQADPAALLDSRSFLAALGDLDPGAADFTTKVEAAIDKAVKDNPKLKLAGQAPARNSAEITGGSGDGAPITEDALKRMTPEQIVKARAEGKLAHLM
jgi:hypothetical protein